MKQTLSMEYIVLISDGLYKHDFKMFPTREEAIEYATKIKSNHYFVAVNKLTEKIYL